MGADRLRAAIGLLCLAGGAVAAYLVYTRYSGAAIFCQTGGCETVQSSKYSQVVGIPVSVLGLVGYVAILVTAAVPGPTSAAVGVTLALVGVAFGAYLLDAQLALVGAVCQWCVANDAVIGLVAIACLWRFRRAQPPAGPALADSGR